MEKQKLLKQWTGRAAKLLAGRTIVAVSYLGDKSCREMMWDRSCLVITLDNGVHFFPSADDKVTAPGRCLRTPRGCRAFRSSDEA